MATTLPHTKQLPTAKDDSFHIKNIRKVTVCKLRTMPCLRVSLIVPKYNVHVRNAPNLWLYYTRNNQYTTKDASSVQVEVNYDFCSAT